MAQTVLKYYESGEEKFKQTPEFQKKMKKKETELAKQRKRSK